MNSAANQSDLEAKMRQCRGQQEAWENISTANHECLRLIVEKKNQYIFVLIG